jgi:LAO/AO transport system kinase
MIENGKFESRRIANTKNEIVELVKHKVLSALFDNDYNENLINSLSKEVVKRDTDPYSACERIMKSIKQD